MNDLAINEDKTRELSGVSQKAIASATALVIFDQSGLEAASGLLKGFKSAKEAVTDFFKPLKDKAYAAHKEICDREKEMLAPYLGADAMVRQKVNAYTAEQERIRREKEAELRRLQEAEMRRLAEEAAQLEADGKHADADAALNQAIMTESVSQSVFVQPAQEKIQGISYRTEYEVIVVDDPSVPVAVSGITIRPVDTAAIKRLAIATKGKIQISGIKITENKKVAVR